FARFREPVLELIGALNNIDANRRALSWRLHYQGKRKSRSLIRTDDLPARSRNAGSFEFFLRFDFIEGNLALIYTISGVGNTAIFQNLLDLAVFAEGPMNGEEGDVDVRRELEIFIANIDLEDFRSARTKRFGNTARCGEGDISLGARSTH